MLLSVTVSTPVLCLEATKLVEKLWSWARPRHIISCLYASWFQLHFQVHVPFRLT